MSADAPAAGGFLAAFKRIPRKAWLRMALMVAILATGFALVRFTPLGELFTREQMIATLERLRAYPGFPLLLIALYGILAPMGLPMTPLVVAGAVVFGPVWGALYNTAGLVLGAMTAFYVGRALGHDFVAHFVGPGRLRRAERLFERRGFWPLVQTRFLPLPFPVVSYGAALAGVKAPQFLVTSTLGLIPATVMHSYFMSTLFLQAVGGPQAPAGPGGASPAVTLAVYLTLWGAFAVVTGWPTWREGLRRRARYRELKERRRSRVSS